MRYPAAAVFASIAILLLAVAGPAQGQDEGWQHATALTGTPGYPPGFARFNYVNPDAPKGGTVRLSVEGSFDSLNPILSKGEQAAGLNYVYETLMTSARDEYDINAEYGLLAEATKHADDDSWVSFRLNPNARWHDGTPVTAEDVIWSFNKSVELNPSLRFYYRNVKEAKKTGDREVTFYFSVANNRELPHIMGQLTVFPKHWWEGTGPDGKKRDIGERSLEAPMGSGPYEVESFEAGKNIVLKRFDGYWGKDLNVNVGTYNFDRIRYEYYRDGTVMLEAFKGDQYDFRFENSAKNWATGYDTDRFPARKKGYVKLEEFPARATGVMQAFVVNLRRDRFKDPRVRRALNLSWDFETAKRTVFYNQYIRDDSYFAGTELASKGLPTGKELEILEKLRGKIPDQVFTEEYENPVGGDPEKVRANLRKALELFKEAGWVLKGRQLVNEKTGEPFTIEYLGYSDTTNRYVLPWKQDLAKIGIQMTVRIVDSAQYINRLRSFDYDMITAVWGESLSPGNEQRNYWGSESANREGSRNYAGIADPAVDQLINEVIFAKDRDTLVAATHALDRVLLWNNFVIPQFYYPFTRAAYWDRFGRPEKLPEYDIGFPDIWWFDKDKAARIK